MRLLILFAIIAISIPALFLWSFYLFFIISYAGWDIWPLLLVAGFCLGLAVVLVFPWREEADESELEYPALTSFRIVMGQRGLKV